MKLILLFKDKTTKEIIVSTVWQDDRHQNYLYYETFNDEAGKGTFLEMKPVVSWKIVPVQIGGNIKL